MTAGNMAIAGKVGSAARANGARATAARAIGGKATAATKDPSARYPCLEFTRVTCPILRPGRASPLP